MFGAVLEAFEYGAPPHGGIALGIDRWAALLSDQTNIREVMAFPKTQSGADLMLEAPSPPDTAQYEELGLRFVGAPAAPSRRPRPDHATRRPSRSRRVVLGPADAGGARGGDGPGGAAGDMLASSDPGACSSSSLRGEPGPVRRGVRRRRARRLRLAGVQDRGRPTGPAAPGHRPGAGRPRARRWSAPRAAPS